MKFELSDLKNLLVSKVNRLEIIGPNGRELVKSRNTIKNVIISLQDNNKTLKIFYKEK